MWWLLVPAAAVVGKLVYDAVIDDKPPPAPPTLLRVRTVLERNLERLAGELATARGRRVGVLGQPGAGKSSLLCSLSDCGVEPLPAVGVHTDATDWSSRNDVEMLCRWREFVFADVPGYDTVSHPVRTMLDGLPFGSFDAFVLVLRGKVREADQRVYARLQRLQRPVVVVRNFAEGLDEVERATVRADLWRQLGCSLGTHLVFASNRSGEGMQEVLQGIS